MLIEAIEIYHLRQAGQDTVLVQLRDGQQSGWGEACVGREPVDSAEWAGGVFAVLRDVLGPAVRGQSPISGDQLQECLARFQGNPAAKAALDCAWWDLQANSHGSTVAALLGGAEAATNTTCRTIGVLPTIDDLIAEIEQVRDTCDVVLLKFRPGWDEQMLRAVRQVYPAIPLAVDCDGGCRMAQREMLYRLDDFMLRWVEQPFPADDLVAHAMLQEQIRTPICLHQSITSVERAEQALDLQSGRIFKLDPVLSGGLTPVRAIHEFVSGTVPLALAGAYQTVAGQRTCNALATLKGFTQPRELTGEAEELSPEFLATAVRHARV